MTLPSRRIAQSGSGGEEEKRKACADESNRMTS